jgi:hypothetical protein
MFAFSMTVNERLEGVDSSLTQWAVIEAHQEMDFIVQEALKNTGDYRISPSIHFPNYYL